MLDNKVFEYKSLTYKLRLIKEWRSSTRYSLGAKYLTIRVPKFYPPHLTDFHIDEALSWAQAQLDKRISQGKLTLTTRKYEDGKFFQLRKMNFKIRVIEKNIKQFSGKVVQQTLILECPNGKTKDHASLSRLVSRVMGKYFHPYISERVSYFNDAFFKEDINTIRLKNNKSNWGSCSSNKNLNFSTRLLFAPDDVIDYVVVHELAHLLEMNHSPAYWSIVAKVMPDYKSKEHWLKTNNHLCYF